MPCTHPKGFGGCPRLRGGRKALGSALGSNLERRQQHRADLGGKTERAVAEHPDRVVEFVGNLQYPLHVRESRRAAGEGA